MVVTLAGIIKLVTPLQLKKALVPIEVTVLGMVNVPVNPLHLINVPSLIVFTLLGISISVIPLQSLNAYFPVSDMLVERITFVSPIHELNASCPKEVTLLGIVSVPVRPVHPLKA